MEFDVFFGTEEFVREQDFHLASCSVVEAAKLPMLFFEEGFTTIVEDDPQKQMDKLIEHLTSFLKSNDFLTSLQIRSIGNNEVSVGHIELSEGVALLALCDSLVRNENLHDLLRALTIFSHEAHASQTTNDKSASIRVR